MSACKEEWTLFGSGEYFIDVVIETIELNGGCVTHLVFNQALSVSLCAKLTQRDIKLIPVESFKPETDKYFFGFVNSNKQAFLKDLAKFGISFANLIHPFSCIYPSVSLGQGNFVGPGSVISPCTNIGNFNTINRSVSVGHHVQIGNFNHLGPGVVIAGRCSIEEKNFLGVNSTMIDGIKIKNNVVLGAGAVAIKDIMDAGTYIGVPATKLIKCEKCLKN